MTLLLCLFCALALLPLLMTINNLRYYHTPAASDSKPIMVSVLIPARNEEKNIAKVVASVLASENIELEVLVLDDNSTDATPAIVQQIAEQDSRVRLFKGAELADGWCGKPFACYQLAQQAKAPLLLFIDADVTLSKQAVNACGNYLLTDNLDFLSGIPHQITKSFGECLIIPLIHFILLGYLPIGLSRQKPSDPALVAGCGQFILLKKQSYQQIGGHAAIKNSWHDGLHLPREFRKNGFRTDICDLTALASCRMYHRFSQVWSGFCKNATDGMAGKLSIIPWTLILIMGQLLPLALLLYNYFQPVLSVQQINILLATVILGYTNKSLVAYAFKQSWLGVLVYPLGILVLLAIQWTAWAKARAGCSRPSWKGRKK